MRKLIVLAIIIAFMFAGYLINGLLKKILKPRESFARLLSYFLFVLIAIFILSFMMVFIISKIYPNELMK